MPNKSVLLVGYSMARGGAAIALRRVCEVSGRAIDIKVAVSDENPSKTNFLLRLIEQVLLKLEYDRNPTKHSLNLFSNRSLVDSIKSKDYDFLNLHWINNCSLSLFCLFDLPYRTVITLHDEWFYCATEHVSKLDHSFEFKRGYPLFSKRRIGLPMAYFIWKVKLRLTEKRPDLIYTVPSEWMKARALDSVTLRNCDVRVLPNPVDTEHFRPRTLSNGSRFFNFECRGFRIVFGGSGGMSDPLKGWGLFYDALNILATKLRGKAKVVVLVFGCSDLPIVDDQSVVEVINFNYIDDSEELAELYSQGDIFVTTSMVESFGLVAAEASACGTPVVCFDNSGLVDIVQDGIGGFLVPAFDTSQLADKLEYCISLGPKAMSEMGLAGRKHILKKFSYEVFLRKYLELFGIN